MKLYKQTIKRKRKKKKKLFMYNAIDTAINAYLNLIHTRFYE